MTVAATRTMICRTETGADTVTGVHNSSSSPSSRIVAFVAKTRAYNVE
jgi:hypothetical protein